MATREEILNALIETQHKFESLAEIQLSNALVSLELHFAALSAPNDYSRDKFVAVVNAIIDYQSQTQKPRKLARLKWDK